MKNRGKRIERMLVFGAIGGLVSISTMKAQSYMNDNPFSLKYENELFSVNMPMGWTCDERWQGLDGMINEVDFYNPLEDMIWVHCVKTFFPFEWEGIEEATEMAKYSRLLCGEEAKLFYEVKGVDIDNYPTSILYFANYVDNNTIIQKQYVTYLKDSHIVIYFNENFYIQNWKEAERLGNMIIDTIKLKKVLNPLQDKQILQKTIKELKIAIDANCTR